LNDFEQNTSMTACISLCYFLTSTVHDHETGKRRMFSGFSTRFRTMKEVRVDEMQNGGPDRVQGQTPVIRLFNEMPQKP